MMQALPRWKVTVTEVKGGRDHVFWVYDNFIANVLRTVAGLDFAVADLALGRGRVKSRGGGPMTAPAPTRCEGGKA
jgi:hypothetical protein